MTGAVPPRRLPVLAIFARSFGLAWDNRDLLIIPYLVSAGIAIALDLAVTFAPEVVDGYVPLGFMLAEQLIAMALAVGLHRFVLLGDLRRGIGFFRFDRNLLRYIGVALAILVLGALLYLAIVFLVGLSSANLGILDPATQQVRSPRLFAGLQLIATVVMLAGALAILRVSLALPAAALGGAFSPVALWRASRGNGLRLLGVAILVLFPFFVLWSELLGPNFLETMQAIQSGVDPSTIAPPPLATVIAWDLIVPFALIASTIMTALSYDFLVRGNLPVAKRAETRHF